MPARRGRAPALARRGFGEDEDRLARTFDPLDPNKLRTAPLAGRPSKVSLEQLGRAWTPAGSLASFLETFPPILAGQDFRELVAAIVAAPGAPAQRASE